MLTQLFALSIYAVATVAAVRWLLLPGLDVVATRMSLSSKTKGQLLGYATSIPELVVVVSAARAGVFEAGFWNIASSNIINCTVFLAAIIFYRQYFDLTRRAFIDELAFSILSVAVPVGLHSAHVGLGLPTAFGLFALFILYKLIDRHLNPKSTDTGTDDAQTDGSLAKGAGQLAVGVLMIGVCGNQLGATAGELIQQVGVPAWQVGWILGFVTSVPEMSSFFAVYAAHRRRGSLHLTHDTQETFDALIASNMGNLGIILPLGVVILALS